MQLERDPATLEDAGKLVLRFAIAGMMLFHGIAKVAGGVEKIGAMLQEVGLPAFIANGVYLGEVVAPILILLGIFVRPAALVVAFTMVVAILLVHRAEIFTLGAHGQWAIELPMLFLSGTVAIALLGGGRFTVAGAFGKSAGRAAE